MATHLHKQELLQRSETEKMRHLTTQGWLFRGQLPAPGPRSVFNALIRPLLEIGTREEEEGLSHYSQAVKMLMHKKRLLLLQPPRRLVFFKLGVKSCLLSVWPPDAWSWKDQFRSGIIVTVRAPTHSQTKQTNKKKNWRKTTEGAVSHDADLLWCRSQGVNDTLEHTDKNIQASFP